jgi:hypothetical protein
MYHAGFTKYMRKGFSNCIADEKIVPINIHTYILTYLPTINELK